MNEYERRLQHFATESCEKEVSARTSSLVESLTHTPSQVSPTQDMLPVNTLPFATVNVFTTTPFKGNQLAIVRVPSDLDLSQETKQAIAREFNFSETVFLHDPSASNNQRRLDIFTLSSELPFAGHPVVGAACYICHNIDTDIDRTTMSCKAGLITCRYDRKEKLAEIEIPLNLRIHGQTVSGRAVLKSQPYLARTSFVTSELPVVSLVKGLSFILINLPSIVPHMEKLEAGGTGVDTSSVTLDDGWEPSFIGCYFYVMASHPNERVQKLRTRMLEPNVGEDAATGSAACTLACYLALKDGRQDNIYQYSINQGIEMGRASEIHVKVKLSAEGKTVHSVLLSGRAVLVTQGSLHLP